MFPKKPKNVTFISVKQIRTSEQDAVKKAKAVKIIIIFLALGILKLFQSAFSSRPQITALSSIWTFGIFFFLSMEGSGLHASQKTENKFWMAMATVFSSILLFLADDSPFRVNFDASGFVLGFGLVSTSTYIVHVVHKRSHRQTLENRSSIPKNESYREAISSLQDKTSLDSLVADVNGALSKLESPYIPGGFRRMFDKSSLVENEKKIIDAFYYASRAELNYLVLHVNLNIVLYRLKNHYNAKKVAAAAAAAATTHDDDHGKDNKSSSSPERRQLLTPPVDLPIDVTGMMMNNVETPLAETSYISEGGKTIFNEVENEEEAETGSVGDDNSSVQTNDERYEIDLMKRNNRNALVQLLAKERLSDLTISARASVLDAIQVVGMMRNPLTKERAQNLAAGIILNTKGDQLSELKTITDAKGSVHSMHKLVYNDITNESIRSVLLQHFQANKRTKIGRKVLSDVDDTLLSSGGRYPAGIDDSYPRHVIYPGAGSFYEALDRGLVSQMNVYGSKVELEDKKKRMVVGNLVFLSARPHIYKDVAEKHIYSKFEKMIKAKNLYAMPTLLPGDLESGQAYMLRGDFEPMARKKLKNMLEYYSIYPEFFHVFVCDNGQADIRAAELMKEKLGAAMEAVYCHEVQPLDKTFGYSDRKKWAEMGIIFYKTFVGAAADAYLKKFIDISSLRQVSLAACEEFIDIATTVKFSKGWIGVEEKRLELVRDFEKANEIFLKEGFMPVQPPRAFCTFPVGTRVYTKCFGEGLVKKFRNLDCIYEVSLLQGSLTGYFHGFDLQSKPWAKTQETFFPGGQQSSHHSDKTVQVGCRVSTPYGEGVVRRFRPSDKIFEVILTKWPALAFLREEDVEPLTSARARIWNYGRGLIRRTFSHQPQMETTIQTAPVNKPSIIPSIIYEIGSRVQVSHFGYGIVINFREEDNILQVKFENFQATGFIHTNSLISNELVKKRSSSFPTRVMNVVFGGSSTSVSKNDMMTDKKKSVFEIGATVYTPYGRATIMLPERVSDGIVKVKFDWGSDGYLDKNVIKKNVEIGGVTGRFFSFISRDNLKIPSNSPTNKEKKTPFYHSVGTIVDTPYGKAQIDEVRFDQPNSPYKVHFMTWKGCAYLEAANVITIASLQKNSSVIERMKGILKGGGT